MLGWHISVYRTSPPSAVPAKVDADRGALLAQWQGKLGALRWLGELAFNNSAVDLGGNGYPSIYTVRCDALRPVVLKGPPEANETWIHEPTDIIDRTVWKGKTFIDHDELNAVPGEEWLTVVAWDET
jgi:hypothetical protein